MLFVLKVDMLFRLFSYYVRIYCRFYRLRGSNEVEGLEI